MYAKNNSSEKENCEETHQTKDKNKEGKTGGAAKAPAGFDVRHIGSHERRCAQILLYDYRHI
ncbi:MAG: hypothetical protein MR704_10905 [Clostridia bacterium]|nr:hypothetical protein [Anaerovorax odorimutans]MCI7302246.1 hypothetical protein [Clostridia bacterium]